MRTYIPISLRIPCYVECTGLQGRLIVDVSMKYRSIRRGGEFVIWEFETKRDG